MLHAVTTPAIQSMHAVCENPGCPEAGQSNTWQGLPKTPCVHFTFDFALILFDTCPEIFYCQTFTTLTFSTCLKEVAHLSFTSARKQVAWALGTTNKPDYFTPTSTLKIKKKNPKI